jgi:GMC oxidoreductase/FAD binding domain
MRPARSTSQEQQYDVCVVGAGPVGLTLALECEAAGLSVLLIEAGNQNRSGKIPSGLSDADISDPSFHAPLEVTTKTGFGGTSRVWGGRCRPFDEIDFERRAFVPHSGWPITNDEMERWYAKAESYFDCGSGWSIPALPKWDQASPVSCETIERLSSQPQLGRRFWPKVASSKLIRVQLGAIVEGIELDSDSHSVSSLRLASSVRPAARAFVLACGGLQNTRILLDLQRTRPTSFNGDEGPLGRFYMGHLTGKIASVVLHDPQTIDQFDYSRDERGYWYRRRFSFDAETQRKDEVLNIAFWLGNPPFHDPSHGSGAASSLHLSLRLPFTRMKYFSREFVSFHRGNGSPEYRSHLANILSDPIDTAGTFLKAAKFQMSRDKLKPLIIRNPRGIYSLHYHSEQIPDASNRVRLKRNSDGSSRLSINFGYCEQDALSVVRAYEILDRSLRQSGKGYVKYWQRPEERIDHVLAQARDGYHQIGTARMDQSGVLGVVDSDCRVHGLKNLYVAGSAVFPTSGQANPTFTAVALAARLADHLAKTRPAPYRVMTASRGAEPRVGVMPRSVGLG